MAGKGLEAEVRVPPDEGTGHAGTRDVLSEAWEAGAMGRLRVREKQNEAAGTLSAALRSLGSITHDL